MRNDESGVVLALSPMVPGRSFSGPLATLLALMCVTSFACANESDSAGRALNAKPGISFDELVALAGKPDRSFDLSSRTHENELCSREKGNVTEVQYDVRGTGVIAFFSRLFQSSNSMTVVCLDGSKRVTSTNSTTTD